MGQRAFLQQNLAHVRSLRPRCEHIVVDGGSGDGSVELLAEQARENPELFHYSSGPDRGMYDALNKGFARARGEFLGYLNCDDLLLPWTLRRVEACFDARPDIDLVFGDALEWELSSGRAALVVHPPATLLETFVDRGGHLAQPAVFFRRRLWERLGPFDSSYRLLGDHEYWLRAIHNGARALKLWEFLAIQTMSPGQLMQRHAAQIQQELNRAREAYGLGGLKATDRRRSQALSRLLHRLGIAATVTLSRLPPGGRSPRQLPWGESAASGLLRYSGTGSTLRALLRSTAGRQYLSLDLDAAGLSAQAEATPRSGLR